MEVYQGLLKDEILRGEKTAWIFRWILYCLVAILAAFVYFGEGSLAGLYGMGMSAMALLYNGVLAVIIVKKRLVPQIRYVSVSFDVIFLTLYNGIDAWANSPLVPVTTATLILYPVLLFLAALRLDRPLIVFATALSIISMNVLYFVFLPSMDASLVAVLVSANVAGQVYRTIYVLLCGCLMLMIPSMVERLLRTQQGLFEESLSHYEMARSDRLTGLANRVRLSEFLPIEIERARRESRNLLVVYIDLDGFKPINDAYGHDAGDLVLSEIGRRLSSIIRGTDIAARVGGDEFVIVASFAESMTCRGIIEERIVATIRAPVNVEGSLVSVDASIGCAQFPVDGDDATSLITAADKAMLDKKKNRKGGH